MPFWLKLPLLQITLTFQFQQDNLTLFQHEVGKIWTLAQKLMYVIVEIENIWQTIVWAAIHIKAVTEDSLYSAL